MADTDKKEDKSHGGVSKEDLEASQMGFGTAFIEWFPCVIYVILYVVLDVLIASEGYEDPITGKRKYNYTPGVLVLLSEAGKLIISVTLLIVEVQGKRRLLETSSSDVAYQQIDGQEDEEAKRDAVRDKWRQVFNWRNGIYYIIPACLYTCWNVINYVSLLHVSLSIYSIIYQSVLFFSAFLWSVTFKKKLTLMQWFALLLLAAGVFVVHVKIPFKIDLHLSALWVLLQAFISAVASVYNEFLYKRPEEKGNSINQQNTYLYIFTTFFSFFYVLGTEGPSIMLPSNFFRGFTVRVVVIVFVSMALGLSVSLILKHRNVIVKLYAQAIHSPLEVVAAHLVLHTELSAMIIVASLLIAVSTYLYYRPVAPPPEPPKSEEEKPVVENTEAAEPPGTDKPDPQASIWSKTKAAPPAAST